MTDRTAPELQSLRKLLVFVAWILGLAAFTCFGLVDNRQVWAQVPAQSGPQGLEGTWQGTLHNGKDYRDVLKISKTDGGGYKVVFYLPDQTGDPFNPSNVKVDNSSLGMTLPFGSYSGKLSADGNAINGSWSQGGATMPLNFNRATPGTEWTIPPPSPKIPPMNANASPGIEVSTIKPTKPDEQVFMLVFRGGHFQTKNISLSKLLAFSYGVQEKQLVDLPAWAQTDKYDIDAKPDTEGTPNKKQLQIMVQKLVADRFSFKFHDEKRELPVYVLTVAKSGQKMAKSEDQGGLPGFGLGGMGRLSVHNSSMDEFVGMMQETVMDRPVLNQTGLTERYDFNLNWTPDDSQFGGTPIRMPPPPDNANPPPNLYTAIQEQIGLKLESTRALADVMIIDHVEKPSEN
jgi:uncharacterized protein (TIGR03435 family)